MSEIIRQQQRTFPDDLVGKIIETMEYAAQHGRRWLHLKTILAGLRVRHNYECKDNGRLVRAAMSASGAVLSVSDRKHGYCLLKHATEDEMQHSTTELKARAKELTERATEQFWRWRAEQADARRAEDLRRRQAAEATEDILTGV